MDDTKKTDCLSCGYKRKAEEKKRSNKCPNCGVNYFFSRHLLRMRGVEIRKELNTIKEEQKHFKEIVPKMYLYILVAIFSGVYFIRRGGDVYRNEDPVLFWFMVGMSCIILAHGIYKYYFNKGQRSQLLKNLKKIKGKTR